MDTSTAFRFHTLEALIHYSIRIFIGALFGIKIRYILYYEILKIQFSIFSHSNIFIPHTIDIILNKIIVTPSIHITHHNVDPKLANTNFCFVLTIWDRIHKTMSKPNYDFCPTLGLSKFRKLKALTVFRLLFVIPFLKVEEPLPSCSMDEK